MNVDIAKELVEQIRSQCSHITLQSRLKSTSSAFKKMLKQAKAKDQLFDLLGLRIIVHMKQANASPVDAIKLNVQPDQPKKREKRGNNLLKSEKDDDLEFEIRLDPNKAEGNNQPATTTAAALEAEQVTLMNIRKVISQLAGWEEDTRRFKDYVRNPKPSGYQSLHMSLLHKSSGMRLEIQLRTERMHDMAEVGPASHLRYKALLLPSSLP